MGEPFANRKQGQSQSKYEERETGDDKKTADCHRHQSRDGPPKYKHLKYADHNDDRQQIAQAVKRVLSKCNQ